MRAKRDWQITGINVAVRKPARVTRGKVRCPCGSIIPQPKTTRTRSHRDPQGYPCAIKLPPPT